MDSNRICFRGVRVENRNSPCNCPMSKEALLMMALSKSQSMEPEKSSYSGEGDMYKSVERNVPVIWQ